MFLSKLKPEEKEKFLDLAYYAAGVDGNVVEEEIQLLALYRAELMLFDYIVQDIDPERMISFFKAKDKRTRKIIFFEIIGVFWIDNRIENEEAALLSKLQVEFNLDDTLKYNIINWMNTDLKEWFDLSNKLNVSGGKLLGI